MEKWTIVCYDELSDKREFPLLIKIASVNKGKAMQIIEEKDGMEQRGFTKECSLIAKSLFVMLMLLHHVFYDTVLWDKDILSLSARPILSTWGIYGKVCVGGFAFISAYGMTKQLMKNETGRDKSMLAFSAKRLIKLESTCLFIYPIAVFYQRFIVKLPVKPIFVANGEFHPGYMLIDAVGLADLFKTPKLNVTWWYLSFAVLLILSLPALYLLYKKVGWPLVFLALLVFGDKKLVAAILGIAFAYDGWFEKLEIRLMQSVKSFILGLIVTLFLVWLSFEIVLYSGPADSVVWCAGALIAFISMMYLSRIPVLARALQYIGKHSGNIFLVHTFIYMYFYEEFIYSFRWAGAIWGVLLLCSLAVSILLELLKKLLRYDVLVMKITNKAMQKLVQNE